MWKKELWDLIYAMKEKGNRKEMWEWKTKKYKMT